LNFKIQNFKFISPILNEYLILSHHISLIAEIFKKTGYQFLKIAGDLNPFAKIEVKLFSLTNRGFFFICG
jgi:hypothetical protein